jgi:hypothetical protein
MSICTAIMAIPSLWSGVLSGTSDEAGTQSVLIWGSLAGEALVSRGILLQIDPPLNVKKDIVVCSGHSRRHSWSLRNIVIVEI